MIEDLRANGERESVEAKSAAGGLPATLNATLSAFGNQPGGGVIILGLDETTGFKPVVLPDPGALRQGLANKARTAVVPPVQISLELAEVDSRVVVIATVDELPAAHKPCRVGGATGPAYLRFHDGDYQLSDLEVQALTAARSQPTFDRQPVDGATRDDLDRELVAVFLETARTTDRRLAALPTDDEILQRTGVLVDGRPSLAGLLALGVFPQQFAPSLAIQAVIPPQPGDEPDLRYRASQRFTGPIPFMLEDAVRWVALNSSRAAASDADGHLRDIPAWPPESVREVIANALVHRDLGPWATSQPISLRLDPDVITVTNPGGLYGLTVQRLQPDNVESFARNSALLQICQYARLPDGRRVVEGLATGIPKVFQALKHAGLQPPEFHDHAVRFTCRLRARPIQFQRTALPGHGEARGTLKERVLVELEAGAASSTVLADRTGAPIQTVRNTLRALIYEGRVARNGGRGNANTTYTKT